MKELSSSEMFHINKIPPSFGPISHLIGGTNKNYSEDTINKFLAELDERKLQPELNFFLDNDL